ncbi:GNAT family N-acetyltransferase [Ornithinimicrobium sufpigmenti]|uniref:GNAT family N-acetyltransferase n=1 Tax=Ornithinimicrobium sufpigmenti TaxID=2508882 RepID=UPI001036332F|nr:MULTISPECIES: GNAT family N-acetyltransferase [unclassified Ornithinimicrobium]
MPIPPASARAGDTLGPQVRAARLVDLDPLTLYGLLRLRVDVFVVEQDCAYPELDGVDTEATTEHLWIEADGVPVATVRTLVDAQGVHHLGRVATRRDHRGHGYASTLVQAGLDRIGGHAVHIGAQAYLERWYERFGFRRAGKDYLEDGIPHLPMVRPELTPRRGAQTS